jgi:hypothetical protein
LFLLYLLYSTISSRTTFDLPETADLLKTVNDVLGIASRVKRKAGEDSESTRELKRSNVDEYAVPKDRKDIDWCRMSDKQIQEALVLPITIATHAQLFVHCGNQFWDETDVRIMNVWSWDGETLVYTCEP